MSLGNGDILLLIPHSPSHNGDLKNVIPLWLYNYSRTTKATQVTRVVTQIQIR